MAFPIALLIPVVTTLISAVVPKLVKKAEDKFPPQSGPEKKKWVEGFFFDLEEVLDSHELLNERVKEVWTPLRGLVSGLIEDAVEKMKKKNAVV